MGRQREGGDSGPQVHPWCGSLLGGNPPPKLPRSYLEMMPCWGPRFWEKDFLPLETEGKKRALA